MTESKIAHIVVCAGGLGTRVASWSRHIPKEFQPVAGKPGIVHLLNELEALAPAQVVTIYHPFYEPFIAWAKTTLTRGGRFTYELASGQPSMSPLPHERLDLQFIPQHGPYGDITSVLNGAAQHPDATDIFVAYADNLYLQDDPITALDAIPSGRTAVVARPYNRGEASKRGVIAVRPTEDGPVIADLVEKPTPRETQTLENTYGAANLWFMDGRSRLSHHFVEHLRQTPNSSATEPKLTLVIGEYARTEPVHVVTTDAMVTDLGNPNPD